MVAKNLLDNVFALPVDERLAFFEKLRLNLLNDPELHPLTEDEKHLLDERIKAHDSNPEDGSPWEEVEMRLLGLLNGAR